ncbi:hypothetical protein VNO77_15905 [Canavalia gladiata]|uniref:Uncharacterized protein n=1 Tax=Canavalia gladiata TaxID=3824 RepID=A0AAN9QRI1_CANGL
MLECSWISGNRLRSGVYAAMASPCQFHEPPHNLTSPLLNTILNHCSWKVSKKLANNIMGPRDLLCPKGRPMP